MERSGFWTSSPSAHAAAKADCRLNWLSCNTFCRDSPGCGITCHDRRVESARVAQAKHNWKLIAAACRNELRGSSESSKRCAKRAQYSAKVANDINGLLPQWLGIRMLGNLRC